MGRPVAGSEVGEPPRERDRVEVAYRLVVNLRNGPRQVEVARQPTGHVLLPYDVERARVHAAQLSKDAEVHAARCRLHRVRPPKLRVERPRQGRVDPAQEVTLRPVVRAIVSSPSDCGPVPAVGMPTRDSGCGPARHRPRATPQCGQRGYRRREQPVGSLRPARSMRRRQRLASLCQTLCCNGRTHHCAPPAQHAASTLTPRQSHRELSSRPVHEQRRCRQHPASRAGLLPPLHPQWDVSSAITTLPSRTTATAAASGRASARVGCGATGVHRHGYARPQRAHMPQLPQGALGIAHLVRRPVDRLLGRHAPSWRCRARPARPHRRRWCARSAAGRRT